MAQIVVYKLLEFSAMESLIMAYIAATAFLLLGDFKIINTNWITSKVKAFG